MSNPENWGRESCVVCHCDSLARSDNRKIFHYSTQKYFMPSETRRKVAGSQCAASVILHTWAANQSQVCDVFTLHSANIWRSVYLEGCLIMRHLSQAPCQTTLVQAGLGIRSLEYPLEDGCGGCHPDTLIHCQQDILILLPPLASSILITAPLAQIVVTDTQ